MEQCIALYSLCTQSPISLTLGFKCMNLFSLYLQRVFQKQLFQCPFYALLPRAPTVNRKQKPFLHQGWAPLKGPG